MDSKRKTPTIRSSNKRPRVLAVDTSWCLRNKENLDVMSFAKEFGYTDQTKCHARYKAILDNHIPSEDKLRLQHDFTNWKERLLCKQFWTEQRSQNVLVEANSKCSTAANNLLVKNSEQLLASTTLASKRPTPPASEPAIPATSEPPIPTLSEPTSVINNENDLGHYLVDDFDVTAIFRRYQIHSDEIAKPIMLESNIQELLALGDVLFLARNQHSNTMMSFFAEELLDKLSINQQQLLRNKKYMDVMDILTCINRNTVTPKQAKLQLLTLAADMDSLKGHIIEGIGDMLTKLPLGTIVEKNKVGEVDIQTRYYEPLLSPILADNTKKVILRWPNKMDEVTPEIRADAIISTLIQSRFGRHLGYGEVKPGDDSTTTQSLCIDTLKLAVLSRNNCLNKGHPIISFQVNGFQLIFYMTQRIHQRFYTMTEIGRVRVSDSLLSIESFATMKNLQTLLYVTHVFWYCCYSASSPNYSPLPSSSSSPDIVALFSMANNSSSKFRDCPIKYN
ncbi:hypothetical protein CU098_005229 [Rhizopus stolonifer]|uniref:Uncharacterized protein n=1 Tax=Rhizopus stolonifer TaxID=4846 RepID=A0A367JHM4_RHIST|nr:hypothetical protein CU098_005229 [Rhizopus stolonifer]